MTTHAIPLCAIGSDYLTDDGVAELARVAPSTVRRWRARKTVPRYVRMGPSLVLYRRAEVTRWLGGGRAGRGDPQRLCRAHSRTGEGTLRAVKTTNSEEKA